MAPIPVALQLYTVRELLSQDYGGTLERVKQIGNGILDWPPVREASQQAGVEVYCVEQDACPGDPIDSARTSLEFMRELTG